MTTSLYTLKNTGALTGSAGNTPRFNRFMTLIATFLMFTIGGCSNNSLAPFQPEISNLADTFQAQATGVTNVSTTIVYTWSNSGTRATVNHSTTTTAGSTLLVVKDSTGTTLYSRALSPSLNEPTAAGAPGRWTITLTLSNYSGTMNFRLQKL